MGVKDEEKLFLKRNSSPFLAALSLEGISPKLVWTKRIGNGDVLTAQEWCNGRTLEREEMRWERVAQILKKVHRSSSLKRMLQRVGGISVSPSDLLAQYKLGLSSDLSEHPQLKEAATYVSAHYKELENKYEESVCHGDISRKNWLISEEDHLYLVDWDSAVLADPAYDIGQLFGQYFTSDGLTEWLTNYEEESELFEERIEWYTVMNLLLSVKETHQKRQLHKMNENILKVHEWMQAIQSKKAEKFV
jgi:thiamine kinase-like enzyme